jgi:hypothetical protein
MPTRLNDSHLVYTIPSEYDKQEYVESLEKRVQKNKDIQIVKLVFNSRK